MFAKLVTAVAAIGVALAPTVASAQKGEGKLVKIGTFDIDLKKDKDTLDLSKSDGKFRGLRLAVAQGEITLTRIQVTYGDGSVHNEDRRITLKDGERTRAIDPTAKDRFVDKVALTIVPDKKGKARLEVFGVATDEGAKTKRVNVVPADKVVEKAPAAPKAGDGKEFKAPGDTADKGRIAGTATSPEPTKTPVGEVTEFGDVLFGAQTVGFVTDKDVIRVGAEIGKFQRIRMRVLENDIFLREMRVVYANGEVDDIAVDAEVKRDTRTKWFPLKGDRFVKEVQFTYRSKPNFKGQARVEVLGDYADDWLGPEGEGRKFNQGWVLLGSDTAGFIGFDKETIKVGRNKGGFKKLRLAVKDRAISLNELRIVYANGETDAVVVKAKVEAGTTFGPIDLKGGTRVIKEIQARYRSRFIDRQATGRGRAVVEIWGQH